MAYQSVSDITVPITPNRAMEELDRLSFAIEHVDVAEGDREHIQHKAVEMAIRLLDNIDPAAPERLVAEARFERIRKRTLTAGRRKRR